jgi:thioredoxin reductase (NADPH)
MYDLIITGAGPAGLTAGLYAARAKIKTVLLEKLGPGGQVLLTDRVENYPGFPEGISGFELIDRIKRQTENFGLEIKISEVTSFDLASNKKLVITPDEQLETRSVILACGAAPRKLQIDGEDLLIGKGVSYCATCDGPFYRDQEVAVIGGGDTAVQEAIFLTRFAKKVYLIHRRNKLRAVKILQDRAKNEEKIEFVWDTTPVKINGTSGVEGLEIKNLKTDEKSSLPVQGVFVFIGYIPNSELVKNMLTVDENGFIITNEDMETSIPGVYAAGDIRSKLLRQITTAVGEGATAAFAVEKHLEGFKF